MFVNFLHRFLQVINIVVAAVEDGSGNMQNWLL